MSEFCGREYNFEATEYNTPEQDYFKTLAHPGDEAPDFTLPHFTRSDFTP